MRRRSKGRFFGRDDRPGRPSIKVTVDLGRGRGEKRYSQSRGDTGEEEIFKWESIYHEAHVGHEEEGFAWMRKGGGGRFRAAYCSTRTCGPHGPYQLKNIFIFLSRSSCSSMQFLFLLFFVFSYSISAALREANPRRVYREAHVGHEEEGFAWMDRMKRMGKEGLRGIARSA